MSRSDPGRHPARARLAISDRRGSVAVEFALVGLVLSLLIIGTLDVGRYQATLEAVRIAADAAGRLALVAAGGNLTSGCAAIPSGTALQTSLTTSQALPMLDMSSLTIAPSCTGPDGNGVLTVAVTASYPFTFSAPMFTSSAITLSSDSKTSFLSPN